MLAIVLCIHVSKLYRWYKHTLSDFSREKAGGLLRQHDITSKGQTVRVPIMQPSHIGEEMAIDEKHIDGEFYSVLTNKQTGKVALLAQTVRSEEIGRILRPYTEQRFAVKVLTRDLANQYDWVGRTCFPNAMQVANKFPTDWSQSQKTRDAVLFTYYPSIKQAYDLICRFRHWYRKHFLGTPKDLLTERLNKWFALVEQADILEINNFKSLVKHHQEVILNYFVKGHTNAIAEANNRKLNTFIRDNQELKDKDFFFFRVKNYFC